MELIKANPDLETLKLTLWIAGSFIIILMGIVAYFLRKQIDVSETLTKAVNNLSKMVAILERENNILHPAIEKRLNDHGQRLDCNDKQIARIETQIENINKQL